MRVGSLLLGFAFLTAAYWSFRLGKAELLIRRGTPESTEHAADLVPGNAATKVFWLTVTMLKGKGLWKLQSP